MKHSFFLVFLVIPFLISAQVGIETNDPEQMLHVEGKVKIADDETEPTRGTMRYSKTGDFEGFSSNGWESFTQKGRSPLPSNPVPVYGYVFGVTVGQYDRSLTIERFADVTSFTSVPAGKFLIITSIHIEPNGLNQTGQTEVTIGRSNNGSIYQQGALRLICGPESTIYNDPFGILLVIRAGESLMAGNETSSDYGVNVKVRGFLVDDLNYH